MSHEEEIEPGSPKDWLRHAFSDLELAHIAPNKKILLEDLCFHAQQATEKALKAVLVANGIPFPKTHNIRTLLEFLTRGGSGCARADAESALRRVRRRTRSH